MEISLIYHSPLCCGRPCWHFWSSEPFRSSAEGKNPDHCQYSGTLWRPCTQTRKTATEAYMFPYGSCGVILGRKTCLKTARRVFSAETSTVAFALSKWVPRFWQVISHVTGTRHTHESHMNAAPGKTPQRISWLKHTWMILHEPYGNTSCFCLLFFVDFYFRVCGYQRLLFLLALRGILSRRETLEQCWGLENVTKASLDIVVSRKWMVF